MITRLHVRPAVPGSVVRDPLTRRPLPPEGALVEPSQYWHRRLVMRDVVEVDPSGSIVDTLGYRIDEDDQ